MDIVCEDVGFKFYLIYLFWFMYRIWRWGRVGVGIGGVMGRGFVCIYMVRISFLSKFCCDYFV